MCDTVSSGKCPRSCATAHWVPARLLRLLAVAAACVVEVEGSFVPTCPGTFDMPGYGVVSLVPTGWHTTDGGAEVSVTNGAQVAPHMGGRAYFADKCTAGVYDNTQYLAVNLLQKTMKYTVDLSGAGCGCNAALYLASMRQNTQASECSDFYCDANNVCGVSCTEIDIQEANQYAWHSTLHTSTDGSGSGAGYGGGGDGWNGPRDWTAAEYGPGASCIDTRAPFEVAVSFPVDASGSLAAMEVTLSQQGHSCPLSTRIGDYKGMAELSASLAEGMTPVVSYWSSDDMLWMDGLGTDKQGPCAVDSVASCSSSVKFYDFVITEIGTPVLTHRPTPVVVPVPTPSWPVEPAPTDEMEKRLDQLNEFCCLEAADTGDFCGTCSSKSWPCSMSSTHCGFCGGKATWCKKDSEPTVVTDQATPPVGKPPLEVPGGDELADGFCCLASPNSSNVCGTCFMGARAGLFSHCGGSRARCLACGGHATWCSAEPVQGGSRKGFLSKTNGDGIPVQVAVLIAVLVVILAIAAAVWWHLGGSSGVTGTQCLAGADAAIARLEPPLRAGVDAAMDRLQPMRAGADAAIDRLQPLREATVSSATAAVNSATAAATWVEPTVRGATARVEPTVYSGRTQVEFAISSAAVALQQAGANLLAMCTGSRPPQSSTVQTPYSSRTPRSVTLVIGERARNTNVAPASPTQVALMRTSSEISGDIQTQ